MSVFDALKAAPKLLTAKVELEAAELRSQLAQKERRIADLEAELNKKHDMVFRAGFYFCDADPFPFCQHCWEAESVRVHLAPPFNHTGSGFGYACGRCGKVFRSAVLFPGTTEPPQRTDESPVIVVGSRSSLREELDRYF